MICRLCQKDSPLKPVSGADHRTYFFCRICSVITADKKHFPEPDYEKSLYLEHNNGIHNQGYVEFLNRLIVPVMRYVTPGMRGLDYGCGPVATASVILREHGINCDDYDPFFYPAQPDPPYDFIISTETFEHFFNPGCEIKKIISFLRHGGFLGIMTELWDSEDRFSSWYYTRDPSHVTFFNRKTLEYMCSTFGLMNLHSDNRRVHIFKRI